AYYPMCHVHEPWEPTPDDPKGGLRANVEYMDKIVGKVLRSLDELGLRENTIVFFTGDNGTGKDGKGTVTELGVRVPMIASGPGIERGRVSRELIDFSDVMPTLAALTGASLPKGVTIDGRSFAPVLQGKPGPSREWIFSYLAYERMLRDKRWLLEGEMAARLRFAKIIEKLPAPPKE
ncbi:MAG: sulfatase-like hydrolase/transferase, partial [Acidobacteria bacterium]|nr:sulfatase-like hydrolase/transferase [Acidobacteriota bacterium]